MDVNIPLLRKVMEHIEAHPQQWVQHNYRMTPDEVERWRADNPDTAEQAEVYGRKCGTTMCVAGWACELSGLKWQDNGVMVDDGKSLDHVSYAARKLLGLTDQQANSIFYEMLTDPREMRALIERVVGETL